MNKGTPTPKVDQWSPFHLPPPPTLHLGVFLYDLRRLIDLHMYDILIFLTNFGYGKTILFQAEMCFLLHYWASFPVFECIDNSLVPPPLQNQFKYYLRMGLFCFN